MNRKEKNARPTLPDTANGQNKAGAAVNAEKKPRGPRRKILLAVCTGVLALAFSTIPALALWLDDVQLLAQPHERTRQAGALALTSDDLYLTRILKKYVQREALGGGYMRPSFYPDAMDRSSNTVIRGYLDELHEAGVLPTGWWNSCSDFIQQTFTSSDNLGFVNYIAYGEDAVYTNSEYCYIVGITVESESQKVVALWVSAPLEYLLPPSQAGEALEAYRAYLGLEEFEGWEDPVDTWFAGSALYSPRAEVMLFFDDGIYQSESCSQYQAFGGHWTGNQFSRSYYCLSAFSAAEDTVRGWQDYARTFPAGTDVWHTGSTPEETGADFDAEEAPLG